MSEIEDAKRLYKRLKNGAVDQSELTPRDFGLLYLYYPWALPDVDPSEGSA